MILTATKKFNDFAFPAVSDFLTLEQFRELKCGETIDTDLSPEQVERVEKLRIAGYFLGE